MNNLVHYRTCSICEAICGIEITSAGDQRLNIRGDKDDPFSRGYICPKAVALQDIHSDKDRLKHPVRRTFNGWKRIGWDEALLGAELQAPRRVFRPSLLSFELLQCGLLHAGSLL